MPRKYAKPAYKRSRTYSGARKRLPSAMTVSMRAAYKARTSAIAKRGRALAYTSLPRIRNSTIPGVREGIVVKHSEYVADMQNMPLLDGETSTPWGQIYYQINPLNAALFPWLSGIANNFAQYRIRYLRLDYKSTTGDSVSSGVSAMGSVMLGCNYNVAQPVLNNKQQFMALEGAQEGKPSKNLAVFFNKSKCHLPMDTLYIGTPGVGEDVKTYCPAAFTAAAVGQQAQANLGSIHVTYEIELLRPEGTALGDDQGFVAQLDNVSSIAPGGTASTSSTPSVVTELINNVSQEVSSLTQQAIQAVGAKTVSLVGGALAGSLLAAGAGLIKYIPGTVGSTIRLRNPDTNTLYLDVTGGFGQLQIEPGMQLGTWEVRFQWATILPEYGVGSTAIIPPMWLMDDASMKINGGPIGANKATQQAKYVELASGDSGVAQLALSRFTVVDETQSFKRWLAAIPTAVTLNGAVYPAGTCQLYYPSDPTVIETQCTISLTKIGDATDNSLMFP